jgi:hypothetical protein
VPLQQEYVREGQIPLIIAPAVERYGMGRGQLATASESGPPPPLDIGFGPGQFAPSVQPADIQGMAPEQFERFTSQQPMFTGEGSLAPTNFQPFDPGSQRFADSFQPQFDIGFGPGLNPPCRSLVA